MNHAGEITPLVDMVRPHVAVVTTVAPVHLEHFADVEEIAQAKAEIFSGIVKGGVAILNRDIETFPILEAAAKASPAGYALTFGADPGADAHLVEFVAEEDFSRVSARVLGQDVSFRLGAPGRHMAVNALAVVLAARAVGLDFRTIAASLAGVAAAQGRGARETLWLDRDNPLNRCQLIDESYNANPASMRAALDLLGAARPTGGGRRIAVIGDMLELGPTGPQLHVALKDDLLRNDVDLVFAAGPLSRHLYDALPPEMQAAWTATAAALEAPGAAALRAGDIVIVKGSN
jgi:UDP-N-acetylmuramoyl-tripeptide--D-alanyl-D-alanine ligase